MRQLVLNYVTACANEAVFPRMARRFLVAKFASAALQARDPLLR